MYDWLSKSALGLTPCTVKWVGLGKDGQVVKLITHLLLVPRLRRCATVPCIPYVFIDWCSM